MGGYIYFTAIIFVVIFIIIFAISDKVKAYQSEIKELKERIMALESAAAAEQKEIMKKEAISPIDLHIKSYTMGKCPTCEQILFDGNKFCKGCGQRIDWGEIKQI